MEGIEIFALVTRKQKQLEDLIDPTSFVLNPEVEKLQNEIAELRSMCEHDYENGVCKYCMKEKE